MKSVCCRSSLVLVVLSMAWLGCSKPPSTPPAAAVSTDLVIEVSGGFAYVPTPADNKLEIAYLKDTKVTGCDVDQLGTDLVVEEGTIVEPSPAPATRQFDLAGAVVTFPDLESGVGALVAVRGDRPAPPYTPQNPADAAQWHDLKWMPRISDQYSSSLNPDWRNMVDGRVLLKGGSIKGMQPADLVVQNNLFEFRKGSTPVFRQALTDRTEYAVRVPANRVTLHLSGAQSGVSRIVIAPPSPGARVRLKVLGRHAQTTPSTLLDGAKIADYCSFYQLMQPVPAESEWLIPDLRTFGRENRPRSRRTWPFLCGRLVLRSEGTAMKRTILQWTTVIALAAGYALTVAGQVQIHPPGGALGGPIKIAVLSDHYLSGEEVQFNNDVNNLVLAELLSSPDFDDYVGDLTIVRHFVPWSVSPAYSNFGFDLGTGAGHCSIAWNEATTTDLVEGAVAASAPFRTIIVGKSTYRFGCAFDSWSYVSSSAFGNRTITHEGGHMLGELYDEYASAALLNTNYVTDNGQLDERNCSTKASPHWTPWMLPGVMNPLACALYGQGIRHSFASCLMGGSHVNLCEVCRRSLTDEIKYLRKQAEQPIPPVTPTPPTSLRIKGAGLFLQPTQPPPPQPGEQPMVRLVIGITRTSNALTVRRATNVTGRYIPDYRRLGRIAYEVSEGGKPLAYGFLRGDPFQVRDYRGGGPQHEINQADSANFIVSIPGETVQRILAANRNLELSVYRVDPSVTATVIPPQAFQELKAKKLATTLWQLVPAELRKMLM